MRADRRKLSRIRGHLTLDELCGYTSSDADLPTPEAVQATLTKLEAAPAPVAVHTPKPEVNTAAPDAPVAVNTAAPKPTIQPHIQPVAVPNRDRHDRERERVNFWMKKTQKRELKEFAMRQGLDLTDFLIEAAVHYMECVAVRSGEGVAVNTSHDDLMIWAKTADDIIMLYMCMTGNRWKPADDRAARQYNDADRRLIEIGLLNTLLNAKGKRINSFAYFIPEIDECLAVNLGEETIEIMLPRRREQWKKMKGK